MPRSDGSKQLGNPCDGGGSAIFGVLITTILLFSTLTLAHVLYIGVPLLFGNSHFGLGILEGLVGGIVHIIEKLPFAGRQLLNQRVDLWADLQSPGTGIYYHLFLDKGISTISYLCDCCYVCLSYKKLGDCCEHTAKMMQLRRSGLNSYRGILKSSKPKPYPRTPDPKP